MRFQWPGQSMAVLVVRMSDKRNACLNSMCIAEVLIKSLSVYYLLPCDCDKLLEENE
jgi:hypothetical protein